MEPSRILPVIRGFTMVRPRVPHSFSTMQAGGMGPTSSAASIIWEGVPVYDVHVGSVYHGGSFHGRNYVAGRIQGGYYLRGRDGIDHH